MSNPQTEVYEFLCLISGAKRSFVVAIEKTMRVGSLNEKILHANRYALAGIDASELILYRVDATASDPQDRINEANAKMNKPTKELDAGTALSKLYPSKPPEDTIHIFVELPTRDKAPTSTGVVRTRSEEEEERDKLGPLPKKAKLRVDITRQLRERWSRPIAAPDLQSLCTHLQRPLTDEEKIPISQEDFDDLVFPEDFGSGAALDAEKISTLFRVSADEYARSAWPPLSNAIQVAPPTTGTEDLFHSSWDDNISKILRLILPAAEPIRNSNRNTSTGLKRPDYGFLFKGHCVFRGEEKGSDSDGDPQQELVEKLDRWEYTPLPYILGYHAKTTNVHYVAITPPPSAVEPLFDFNLNIKEERVANLVHLIRMSGVIAWLGGQLGSRSRPEFATFGRDGGLVQMTIGRDIVKKEFRHEDAAQRVSKLVEIYDLLKNKGVPNVDKLKSRNLESDRPHVYLEPVGIDMPPKSGSEAFRAVVCVLEALKVMHSNPNPVYHRDIREPNIIRKFDDEGWFLIDWSDASTAPTRAVTHLKESEHSPRVRRDGHGAEVDMWGIGRYLEEMASRVTCQIAKPDAVQEMARRWMSDVTISAATALDEVNAAQELFFKT